MLIPVILAGGSGTRLWPLSRRALPKQFLPLAGKASLFEDTLARLAGHSPSLALGAPLVIVSDAHRFVAAEQLRRSGCDNATLILEPDGRNTAPAATIAALLASQGGVDGASPRDITLLVLPSDHVIDDPAGFRRAVIAGEALAGEGWLTTFGVEPRYAETGYGYVELAEALGHGGHRVRRFTEKPPLQRAEAFVAGGRHLWNSGMFVLRPDDWLAAMQCHAADTLEACRDALAGARQDLDFLRLDVDAYRRCASASIDRAVMERSERVATLPLAAGWNDLGSFPALWQSLPRDACGNAVVGDAIIEASDRTLVHASHRLVAVTGVTDLVVVETRDAVLVARQDQGQRLGQLVARLEAAGRREVDDHPRVGRPWGHYLTVDAGPGFRVKHLSVAPGGRLSLQRHRHRAEHWVVVRGRARVTLEGAVNELTANQSLYVPLGAWHRLENPGSDPLELIEVQTGDYLGEDDIERCEDQYGRE